MALGSNVNPNFPIPGLDQNSKGFRDNFAIIKRELEQIQGTTVQLIGAISGGPVALGVSSSLILETAINSAVIALLPPAYGIQYNDNGLLKGSENFIFDEGNVSVGIGTSFAANISLRTGNAIHAGKELVVYNTLEAEYSNLRISTANVTLNISNLDSVVEFNTNSNTNFEFKNSDAGLLYLEKGGNVGIGTNIPSATLHVVGASKDIGRLYTNPPASDSIFRLATEDATSTIAVGLEHKAFGWLGGMRIDSQGTISIHSGESQDAYLSTTTARIAITNEGSVGIGYYNPLFALDVNGSFRSTGITDLSDDVVKTIGINNPAPAYTLDIVGDMQLEGTLVLKPYPIVTYDPTPVLIDAWSIADYRSARYLLQAVAPAPEVVHTFEFVCFHANESPYVMDIASLSSGTNLGSTSVAIVDGFFELMFSGTVAGTVLKLTKTYIPM